MLVLSPGKADHPVQLTVTCDGLELTELVKSPRLVHLLDNRSMENRTSTLTCCMWPTYIYMYIL